MNSDMPSPTLLPYATTKGAIANISAWMAQVLGDRASGSTASRRARSGPR